ncbi:MAG: histidine--tRNA ligase [Acidobacteria bacterium]|jgi:histidyl-tRNA synthetase|nr:histidine--tRNA ligase [Acidobacteriota bacterium]
MPSTQPARGMRDFLPADLRRRAFVIDVIARVYQRYGFEPLETPAVENIETLLGKYGEEGNQLIFKILKRGEHAASGQADLALRYDLTVPLARVVAEHRATLPKFFKRYQIQPVWRADRPARGRFREFYQCDVDAIGSTSLMVEAELCAAASEALTTLGFADFSIRLNHRAVLDGMLSAAGVVAGQHGDALVALDKLDKIGRDGVLKEFEARGLAPDSGERLLDLLARIAEAQASSLADPNGAALHLLAEFVGTHEAGLRGLAELRDLLALAPATAAAAHLRIDPSLARGLSYYTGAIVEIAVPDLAGSLGGGGRYDGLVGMFLEKGAQIPACGFSLGLERIIVVMTERGMFPASLAGSSADVMVTVWNADARAASLALAHDLRAAGLRVDVYPEADKLGKQMKYAASRDIPVAAILGDDEVATGMVAVKDLRSGAQVTVPRADVAAHVRGVVALPA